MMRTERGFSLVEVMIAIAVGVMFISAVGTAMWDRYRTQRLEQAIEEARTIASAAERYRRQVQSTTVNADGVYQHTYGSLGPDAPVSDLNSKLGTDYPEQSPYGTDYRITATNQPASVTVEVPDDDFDRDDVSTTSTAGGVEIEVQENRSRGDPNLKSVRHQWYKEDLR